MIRYELETTLFRKLMEMKTDREYSRMRESCELLAMSRVSRMAGLTLVCHPDSWDLVKDLEIFERVVPDRVEERADGLLGITLSPVQLESLLLETSLRGLSKKAVQRKLQRLGTGQFSTLYAMSKCIVDALVDTSDPKRLNYVDPAPSVIHVHEHPGGNGDVPPSESPMNAL